MNIQRFYAATAREALAKARMTFGEGTLILSNRATATGVEVVATGEEALQSLDQPEPAPAPAAARSAAPRPAAPRPAPARADLHADEPLQRPALAPAARNPVQEDTEKLAMSTLSFQDYVRERMLRRRHEALQGSAPAAAHNPPLHQTQSHNQLAPRQPALPQSQPLPASQPQARAESWAQTPQQQQQPHFLNGHEPLAGAAETPPPVARFNPLRPVAPAHPAPPAWQQPAHLADAPAAAAPLREHPLPALQLQHPAGAPAAAAPALQAQGLMHELQSVKDLIEERFNTLSWLGQARQNPIQSNLMLKLIRAGYSPALARALLERMPESLDAAESVRWLMEVLERNLKTDAGAQPLYQEGGIYALVGSTGVGKTTTTAKLAALCARVHGPGSVGLITLDTYRVGAHEQLRAYGRMLGIVAHLAHDRAALQDLLGLLGGKKMVLIDSTGVAPRDPRKRDMLDVLNLPHVRRLVVLNASSHGDTLDDTLTAFKTEGTQQAILSKVDEAVKLGPAIDALVRHQMVLRGVTNGQRVPEDWEAADAHRLVATSMRAPARSAFDPAAGDLNFFFTTSSAEPRHDKGSFHA